MSKVLVTSALPYPNGWMHLGHVAWVYLPADIYTRYMRQRWHDVIHICGTDDHGVALEIAAKKNHTTTDNLISRYRKEYIDQLNAIGIDFTMFYGTDTKEHEETAHEFFHELYKQWLLTEKELTQPYCIDDNQFLADRYIQWTCYICNTPGAYWDQCEACGSMMDSTKLIDPICKICWWNHIENRTTKHLYLELAQFTEQLVSWLETKRSTWKTNVVTTALDKWIKDGLHSRWITRDLTCWISVPLEWYETKKLYVWFEACLWYISITKYRANSINQPNLWRDYWLNPDTKLVQFIGKDNIVFHSIIRPALILWHNATHLDKIILPTEIPANEFLNLEGKKFSTSRNYAVWLGDIARDYNPEYVRYYLTTCIPETADANFYRKEFQSRSNDLCDTIWNLLSRTVTLIIKYMNGQPLQNIELTWAAQELFTNIKTISDSVALSTETYHFRNWVQSAVESFKLINWFIAQAAPRETAKSNPDQAAYDLSVVAHAIVHAASILAPYLPETSRQLITLFTWSDNLIEWSQIWDISKTPILAQFTEKPAYLFTKIADEAIESELEKLGKM